LPQLLVNLFVHRCLVGYLAVYFRMLLHQAGQGLIGLAQLLYQRRRLALYSLPASNSCLWWS
jgi:hypothetical protein